MRRLRAALSLQGSPIGRGASPAVGAAMAALGLAAAAFDMGWLPLPAGWTGPWSALPALGAVAMFALLLRGDRGAIGARLSPLPSPGYWVRAALVLAAIFAVIVAAGLGLYVALGLDTTPPPPTPLRDLWRPLVEAPLVEEVIYRWALATGVAALGPRWLAVLVSGAAFGYLHVVHGAHAPNNLAAGFIFAWMYLRSGSIAVPIAFHALGNAAVAVLNPLAHLIW